MTVAATEDDPTTTTTTGVRTPSDPGAEGAVAGVDGAGLVEEDLLVEDVSIDGMCGVY